jgi:hypothetical protein
MWKSAVRDMDDIKGLAMPLGSRKQKGAENREGFLDALVDSKSAAYVS